MDNNLYDLNQEQLPNIAVYLLINLAAQFAIIQEAILDELGEERAQNILNKGIALAPDKIQNILEDLYTRYGRTPKI